MARWPLMLGALLLLSPTVGRAQETPPPPAAEAQAEDGQEAPASPAGTGGLKRKKKKKKKAATPSSAESPIVGGPGTPSTGNDTSGAPPSAGTPEVPPPETDEPGDSDDAPARPGFDLRLRASLSAGAFQGWQVRKAHGALLLAEAAATPTARYGDFSLRVPLRLSQRKLFGATLPETQGFGGLELTWKQSRSLKLSVEGGLAGFWRPDWPDLYQPLADGGYAPTSRESHLDQRLGVELESAPVRRHHLRVSYRFRLADYAADPNFDPFDAPMHLTPTDHTEHELELGWRYVGKGFRLMAGVSAFGRQDTFFFARDAGTGKTHAGPGGLPPNPLQSLRGAEPSLGGKLWLFQKRLEVEAHYGFELVEDRFQGYYSYTGHHPELQVEYSPVERLSLKVSVEAWLRRYGANSYAEGPGHPPLTFGDRRVDRRGVLGGAVRYALRSKLSVTLEGRWVVRKTNFPPYTPGVFPSALAYDIDWNYQNWLALAGLEYRR